MADGDDLELNALSRFTKRSPRLVLEEHDHCEVPAGCGGVVLRWRDPNQGVPLLMWLYSPGTREVYLDGLQRPSARQMVDYGRHVLALALAVPADGGAFVFAATNDPQALTHTHQSPDPTPLIRVCSAPDGTWLHTTEEPPEGWSELEFDDSSWTPLMSSHTFSEPDWSNRGAWSFGRAIDLGGAGLGAAPGRIWVRRTFAVQPPPEGPDTP